MTVADVERVDVFSRWFGFAAPSEAAKVTVHRLGGGLVREVALGGPPEPVPLTVVADLITALVAPPVPVLDPTGFGVPVAAAERHFGSLWTNDHPSMLVRLTTTAGRVIDARSDSQHVYLLPWRVGHPPADSFDPHLSRAVAALLPADHHLLDKLLDRHGILQSEAAEVPPAGVGQVSNLPDSQPAKLETCPTADRFDQFLDDLMSGTESPAMRAESERAGRLSERLLRTLSAEAVRDLLSRGADPNIADDVGQTALMHAAFPPLAVERFRLLAAAGAAVDARRHDGLTGLHLACCGGEARAAAEWVRAGADVHLRTTEDAATPLLLAVRWPTIVELLLAAGADPNALDRDGHGPLAAAVIQQGWVSVEDGPRVLGLLLAAGADVHRADGGGITPLGHARRAVARGRLEAEVDRAFGLGDRRAAGVALAEAVADVLVAAGGRE